jgi:hypothetical protein
MRQAARLFLAGLLVGGALLARTGPALGQASGWSVVPSPNRSLPGGDDDSLRAVSCVSATACTAVGNIGNRPLIASWNGAAWSEVAGPWRGPATDGDDLLLGVSCVTATACTAVGTYDDERNGKEDHALIESWNGTTWSVVPSPNPGSEGAVLSAVSCVSATACTAVGDYAGMMVIGGKRVFADRALIESWNGTAWSVARSPNPRSYGVNLYGVSCVSATACTAVGWYSNGSNIPRTLIESWNGTAWSLVPSRDVGPPSSSNYLYGVSCTSPTACFAVGWWDNSVAPYKTFTNLIESWNGTSWSVVRSPDPGFGDSLDSVSCVSATACTAVGTYGGDGGDLDETLIVTWNGTSWSLVPSPNPVGNDDDNLLGVSCDSPTDCTAAGFYFYNSNDNSKTLIESNGPS